MDRAALLSQVDELVAELEGAAGQVKDDVAAGLELGEKLRESCRTVADASSNSWVGWHARMYYRNYREPPVDQTWDTEWGGVHGYPDAWKERTLREIQDEIERRAGLTLGDVAAKADAIREVCEPLQREVLTVISPICEVGGFDKEAEILKTLEGIDWIVPPGTFIEVLRPSQLGSRDSRAMSQGMQVPLHLNVETAVVSNTSTISTCRDFLNDSIRLARQVRTKLAAPKTTEPLVAGDQD